MVWREVEDLLHAAACACLRFGSACGAVCGMEGIGGLAACLGLARTIHL